MSRYFSDSDRDNIAAAVKAAEAQTSGEIVPVIVEQSGSYAQVYRTAGIIGALLGAFAFEILKMTWRAWDAFWLYTDGGLFTFIAVGAGIVCLFTYLIPGFRRFLIGSGVLNKTVHQRALKAFVDHEVFDTRERTGIVLLVSLFEHRVEVFGDSAINEVVSPEDWAHVITDAVAGIKRGKPTDGLIAAIERCGKLLERKGVHVRHDDENELPNAPRMET